MFRGLVGSALAGVLLSALPVYADVVEYKTKTGITATAEYRTGKADLPAVLLLHGFLQTRDFPTVERLNRALSDAGYTTLAPTLTLGVNRRERSVQCEAIHTHGMEDEIEEVANWVKWLAKRGHAAIVLVGHSFADFHLLSYAAGKPHPAVKRLVLISLVGVGTEMKPAERERFVARARAEAKANPRALVHHPISFCREYPTPAAAYWSYLRWTPETTLAALAKVRLPVRLIQGGADDRGGEGWHDRLKSSGVPMDVVDGANHFLDGEHEFDLHDLVLAALKTAR